MAFQGPNEASTAVIEGAAGQLQWENPEGALLNDGVSFNDAARCKAIIGSSGNQISNNLKITDFGFSIPANAEVKGISFTVQRAPSPDVVERDEEVLIVKNGNSGSENKATTTWNSTTFGGEEDLWGEEWTPEDINSSDFGIIMSCYMEIGGDPEYTLRLFYITATVYYEEKEPGLLFDNENSTIYVDAGDLEFLPGTNGRIIINDIIWPVNQGNPGDAILSIDGRTLLWSEIPGSSPKSLEELNDVTITSPTNGEVLAYNNGSWINKTFAEAGIATNASLLSHIQNTNDPHSVTSSQIGGIGAFANISASVGNINFVGGSGISITPNDTAKTITITNIQVVPDIGDLTEVTLTDISEGETLVYDDGAWINQTPSEIDIASDNDIQDHISNTSNPHSLTASQVGALVSVNSVINAGGNIDLIAGSGISITPDDGSNTITIESTGLGISGILVEDIGDITLTAVADGEILVHSSDNWINQTFAEADIATNTDLQSHISDINNPHSVTAEQIGALISLNSVTNAGGNIDLIAGSGISITPDDGSNAITIESISMIADVVSDTSPQLGGNLDTNQNIITTSDNNPLIIKPHGTGALQSDDQGDLRGQYAVDWQMSRTTSTQVASGNHSIILGGSNNTASEIYSIVGGGDNNTSSGQYSIVLGGQNNVAAGNYSVVLGGLANVVSGDYSIIGGGSNNSITADYSCILGGFYGVADHYCQFTHASGRLAADGDSQTSILMARGITTDDTESELFLDGVSERLTLEDQDTWAFKVYVVGRCVSGTDADQSVGYTFSGCIQRTGTTTSIIGAGVEKNNLATLTGWDVNVVADDTNESLRINVSGPAAHTIRWLAKIKLVEVNG